MLPSTTTYAYFFLESHIHRTSQFLSGIQGGHVQPDLTAGHGGSSSEGQGVSFSIVWLFIDLCITDALRHFIV